MKKSAILILMVSTLAGCALNARYVAYTAQQYPGKPRYAPIPVYLETQPPPSAAAYSVIGRVELNGHASDAITMDTLTDKAKDIARKKGADAIINAREVMLPYGGVYIVPGHYGYYHNRPPEYVPYNDAQLTFRGELAVAAPGTTEQPTTQ